MSTRKRNLHLRRLNLLIAVGAHFPYRLIACAVCYGDPNDVMVKSANAGVAFLLTVVASVLVAFGTVFWRWNQRSKKLGLEADS